MRQGCRSCKPRRSSCLRPEQNSRVTRQNWSRQNRHWKREKLRYRQPERSFRAILTRRRKPRLHFRDWKPSLPPWRHLWEKREVRDMRRLHRGSRSCRFNTGLSRRQ